VEPFGIRLLLAEPGFIRTQLGTSTRDAPARYSDYAAIRERLTGYFKREVERGASAESVARRLVNWAERPGRSLRRRFGWDAGFTPLLKKFLPERFFVLGARFRFGV
jgi:hypothetical protein